MEPESGPDWKTIFLYKPGVVVRSHVPSSSAQANTSLHNIGHPPSRPASDLGVLSMASSSVSVDSDSDSKLPESNVPLFSNVHS